MSVTECALCGRAADSRSMQNCEACGAPLCADCAKMNRARCMECADDAEDTAGG